MPARRAANAWPSSCTISDAKNSNTVTTVARYATSSEECRASLNDPDSRKISTNSITNQVPSTPIRIPATDISLIDRARLNMLQWWHSNHRPTEHLMATPITELKQWTAEISDLRHACAVLEWDKNTMMPPLGAPLRTEQLATLERITHERFTSERTGELIAAAEAELDGIPADSIEARSVSETRRLYEKDRRVPLELAVARAKAARTRTRIWVAAREADDFAAFTPALERNVGLDARVRLLL